MYFSRSDKTKSVGNGTSRHIRSPSVWSATCKPSCWRRHVAKGTAVCTPAPSSSNTTQQAKCCNMAKSFKHSISSSCNEDFSCGLQHIRSSSVWSGGVTSQKETGYSSKLEQDNIFQCSNIVKSSGHSVPSSWNEIESFRVVSNQTFGTLV